MKNNVIELGPERVKRKARDLFVECPRCGKKTFMRHTRCQSCGLWFSGEAFQFAPRDDSGWRGLRQSHILKRVSLVILAIFAALLVVALAVLVL